ncbi:30S ribosomal protein S4e [Candidatus Methanosphaera massiliense]|jgi:small subunit ribosomal protein S4e|uniref:30S ribosomal protein S4e n=1 Tax=Methanosphaera TaxID=2316 RepID=UPI000DC4DD4A|nr:30S ribosomal protein S4e [Candidatus Methanosphaera massiliense]MDD6285200.1 30S ribosomal protein S4e [Methanobacteriaceae archaeon]MDE4078473.1 30S ribosomal protein S4e [Candidatus Methanosphaera massiliense]MDY2744920.1 30S ribosomal protein S4e [Methanosphaera sp.]RAP45533.1 MAG: 30S ribosomal protein S4e [Methanosphaera sp. SHI1033]
MANMGSRKHLKRFKAPKTWPIHTKEEVWTTKTSAGPHAITESIPLVMVLREILGLAENTREAKIILNNGDVLVDGVPRKDHRFPVGFMDVISIPKINKYYRILQDNKGALVLHEIEEKDSTFKLVTIKNKTTVKGGKTQLNLEDGRNVITEEDYKTGDVLLLNIPDQTVSDSIKFEEGAIGLITGGKHIGETGKIDSINITKSSKSNTVLMETEEGSFLTLTKYVFVIGQDKPVISLLGDD